MVGALALAQIANVKGRRASKFRLRSRGTAPGAWESQFAFPPYCSAWSRRDNVFDVRDEVSEGDREEVRAQLVAEWKRPEAERAADGTSNVAQWVSGCPARISAGGVGGGRMLGMAPEPVLWPTWQPAVGNHRSDKGSLIEYVDANGASAQRSAQRAKPPSAGGTIVAYSSPTGKKLSLPAPASLSEALPPRRSCRDRVRTQIW